MTKQEYSQYEKNVEQFLTINKVKPGCYSQTNPDSEPSFSWSYCECCKSQKGGNREKYTFISENPTFPQFEANICTDCIYYLEYGQLDDLTMLEIGE